MLDPQELELFNQRCPEVFTKVHNQYFDQIFILCNKHLKDEEKAHYITQETFITLWECPQTFEREQNIKAFLYKSARNKCIDEIRRFIPLRKYLKWKQQGQHFEDPQVISDQEAIAAIMDARRKLPPELQQIIHLVYDCRLKNKEIADDLNVSIDTVKGRKKQAIAQLKKLLANLFAMIWLWPW